MMEHASVAYFHDSHPNHSCVSGLKNGEAASIDVVVLDRWGGSLLNLEVGYGVVVNGVVLKQTHAILLHPNAVLCAVVDFVGGHLGVGMGIHIDIGEAVGVQIVMLDPPLCKMMCTSSPTAPYRRGGGGLHREFPHSQPRNYWGQPREKFCTGFFRKVARKLSGKFRMLDLDLNPRPQAHLPFGCCAAIGLKC